LTPVEFPLVSLGSDEGLDATVHPHGREEERPRNLGPLLPKEPTDESLVAKPRHPQLVVFAHRTVLPEGANEPGRVRPKMGRDRGEEVGADLRQGLKALEVVLESAREGAARKSREIEHGRAASQD